MSANLHPAIVGHPGVEKQSSAQRRLIAAHANLILPAEIEVRFTYRDGTQSRWARISRGAMSLPPAATLVELRRVNDVHR